MVGGIGKLNGFDSVSISQYRQILFGRIDTNGDGSIVKSELEAVAGNTASGPSIADIISALDSDGDGAISRSESDAALDQRMGLGDFPANINLAGGSGRLNNSSVSGVDDFFSAVDTNGDDMIDTTEMETFLTAKDMEFDQAIFNSMDTDGDGSISRAEMDEMQAHMAPPPPPPPPEDTETSETFSKLFSTIDTNGDGIIDRSELEAYMEDSTVSTAGSLTEDLDTDGDGKISSTEAETARLKIQESFYEELLSNSSAFKFQYEQMLEAYASIFNNVTGDDSGGSLSTTA